MVKNWALLAVLVMCGCKEKPKPLTMAEALACTRTVLPPEPRKIRDLKIGEVSSVEELYLIDGGVYVCCDSYTLRSQVPGQIIVKRVQDGFALDCGSPIQFSKLYDSAYVPKFAYPVVGTFKRDPLRSNIGDCELGSAATPWGRSGTPVPCPKGIPK